MRVFITGMSGFLGSSLAAHLASRGHQVRGSSSGASQAARPDIVPLPLGRPVDPGVFAGTDVVVHAAYDLAPGAGSTNVSGTIAIAEAAKAAGVGRQIFISSYSAHPGAVTEYGRTKLELENYFLARGWAAVRPGLVIGRGGLYARIAKAVTEHWAVPLVCPGSVVPIVAIGDLDIAIGSMIEQGAGGLAGLYVDQRVTMRQLVGEIRRSVGSRAILIPVPYAAAFTAIALIEGLGKTSPLQKDNIQALRANQAITAPGDLMRFVPAPRSLRESVDAAH